MKSLILTAVAVGLAGPLAACSKPETSAKEAAAPPAAAPASSDMARMDMPADAKMAKGAGQVTAVDVKAGTITLDHGPIPEAGWPAMTMSFKAAPAITSAAKVGDKVAFDLRLQGDAGEVTAIRKR